ncbi:carboxymuconolactone decarboxylase family protein [Fulvivirgaceae bacterium PWU4]|uniref:Carboxymuconolactone decarboxylase family protein n=1 Tax=Chryseosolibacter histidini TaxID=2782349 RepID=A0AAP2DFA1_9BACT|nr:carboxymuconolactone decarboxylase family protein [Chryseosolibacter histidini]MBT1695326.1 carboxymuconolactone decarboxylase family protein [Chryseosolibacter histidini]
MKTKLAPIEKPSGLMMKFVYWMTRKKYGKVMTPLKVISARLPLSFGLFVQKLEKLEKKYQLPQYLAVLVRTHVAQLNVCGFCIDIGKMQAITHYPDQQEKFFNVSTFKTSPLFTAGEKAALLFAEELTLYKKISDETFAEAQKHFSERELVEIAWAVTREHIYNLMNRAFDIESDGFCQIPAPWPDTKRSKDVVVTAL